MPGNFLITGNPGVGKTTFLIKLAGSLNNQHPEGFYTEELREEGRRKGFEIVGFDGSRRILSHVSFAGGKRVGRYGVDVSGFDEYIRDYGEWATGNAPVIIDEIGKMECYSPRFRNMVMRLLGPERLFIATIARHGDDFIEGIKARNDVIVFEVTRGNRDSLLPEVLDRIARNGLAGTRT